MNSIDQTRDGETDVTTVGRLQPGRAYKPQDGSNEKMTPDAHTQKNRNPTEYEKQEIH